MSGILLGKKGKVICLFLVCIAAELFLQSDGKGIASQFTSKKDKEECGALLFIKTGNFRRVSELPMDRSSAAACCALRGMTLYSAELIDDIEFPNTFAQNVNISSGKWYWSSGNNFVTKREFTWQFGDTIGSKDARSAKWYKHVWANGEPSTQSGQCVLVQIEGQQLILKSASCRDKHSFICETEPAFGGKDLVYKDIMLCQNAKAISDVPGYPTLKVFPFQGSWRRANLCCQLKGWSLISRVAEKGKAFRDALLKGKVKLPAGYEKAIWSSGNDLCRMGEWKYVCGNEVMDDWLPDNAKGLEDCLMYEDSPITKDFKANDEDCNTQNMIVCDTVPRCSKSQQYPCGRKESRTYDILDTYDEDITKCDRVEFKEYSSKKDPNYGWIWLFGDANSKMSWAAARDCCKNRGLDVLHIEEKEHGNRFNEILLDASIVNNKWVPVEPIWTSASNLKKPMRSSLTWPENRKVVDEKVRYSGVRLHDDIHPMCAKAMTSAKGTFRIFTASCLEQNLVGCMKRNESFPMPKNKDSVDGMSLDIPSVEDDKEQDALYNRSKQELTNEEKELGVVVFQRDKCYPVDFISGGYNESCPKSCTGISANKKPSNPVTDHQLSAKELFEIKQQNKRLMYTIVELGVSGKQIPSHPPKYGFNLLGSAIGIYSKVCPIVTAPFLQNAYRLFRDIHWATSQGRSDILTSSEYKWILKILQDCGKYAAKPVWARTDVCGEEFLAVNNCTDFVCTSPMFEFNLWRTDPLVDIMWKVYEVTHAVCFPTFEESYRMYHKFAQSIMDLWSNDIKLRWFNQIGNDKFWQRILGTSYELMLVNMERCNQAAIKQSFFHIRLPRNTVPDRVRLIGAKDYKN